MSYYLSTNQTMTEIEDEQFYRDTESIAFPKLDDRQLAMLEALGARRIVRSGELIYRAGQRDLGLTVVLRGSARVHWGRRYAHGHCSGGQRQRQSGRE